MKIAFLCEGPSENDSVIPLLNKLNISYSRLTHPEDTPAQHSSYYIYVHNYKGMGKIKPEYQTLSKLLIDSFNYEKIFVWFDNGKKIPVCEYANAQYSQIAEYKNKIELVLSVKCLENWFLSNKEIFNSLFEQRYESTDLLSRGLKDFFTIYNVDSLNAKEIISELEKGTKVEHFPKWKLAPRFFSLIDLSYTYNSASFTRFINKMKNTFI